MRTIINISLPAEMAREVTREVKRGRFASKSEFFRHLLRTHQLSEELQEMRTDFERGDGKKLTSLKDLS